MKICLKTLAKEKERQQATVNIEERLPSHVHSVSALSCEYQVELVNYYYLLTLHVTGEIKVICQRCMQEFKHHYTNDTQLAVCANDDDAEKLMAVFECIVASNNQVDLKEILTDDLYLFLPEKHIDPADCD